MSTRSPLQDRKQEREGEGEATANAHLLVAPIFPPALPSRRWSPNPETSSSHQQAQIHQPQGSFRPNRTTPSSPSSFVLVSSSRFTLLSSLYDPGCHLDVALHQFGTMPFFQHLYWANKAGHQLGCPLAHWFPSDAVAFIPTSKISCTLLLFKLSRQV
jgi:hypothetical protein